MFNPWILKRTLAASVLLFLCACEPKVIPRWEGERIRTPSLISERWVYLPEPYSALSLEYTVYPPPTNNRFFINLNFQLPEPCVEVTFKFEEETILVACDVLKGWERIEIPESMGEKLLEKLTNRESFTIRVFNKEVLVISRDFYPFEFRAKTHLHSIFGT